MKKYLFATVALLIFSGTLIAQVKKFHDLIGKWDITGAEAGASLEIIDSSNIYLTYMGERKKVIDYTLDFSKSPSWFDFAIQDSSGVLQVKSLVQVFGNNALKWQVFIEEERTPHFTASSGEIMYLKKSVISSAAVAKAQ